MLTPRLPTLPRPKWIVLCRMALCLMALLAAAAGCSTRSPTLPHATPAVQTSTFQTSMFQTSTAPAPTPSPVRRVPPTAVSSRTPYPTPLPLTSPGPAASPTMQPPLAAHRWAPQPVLVWAGLDQDEGPELVLYASGQIILRNCADGRCGLETATLKRGEVCGLLNSIDQMGFLDYDPAGYVSPQSGETVVIEVNAWRSLRASLDQLKRWLQDPSWLDRQQNCSRCVPRPQIPPAVRNTYRLLESYTPTDLQPYRSERLAVWLSLPWVEGAASPWALTDLTLASLDARSQCAAGDRQAVVLEGEQALRAAAELNQPLSTGGVPVFSEGDLHLQAVGRWLVPGEVVETCSGPVNAELPPAPVEVSCTPQDGMAPTPNPFSLRP